MLKILKKLEIYYHLSQSQAFLFICILLLIFVIWNCFIIFMIIIFIIIAVFIIHFFNLVLTKISIRLLHDFSRYFMQFSFIFTIFSTMVDALCLMISFCFTFSAKLFLFITFFHGQVSYFKHLFIYPLIIFILILIIAQYYQFELK